MPVKLKLPPRIKVLEALSSIADGRISVMGNSGEVVSSDGTRRYRVVWDPESNHVYSNDNGTIYRGYIGYPIIALLMVKGVIPYREDLAEKLKGIPWRKLNEKYKSYRIVEGIVKKIFSERGGDPEELDLFVDEVMRKLSSTQMYFDEGLIGN